MSQLSDIDVWSEAIDSYGEAVDVNFSDIDIWREAIDGYGEAVDVKLSDIDVWSAASDGYGEAVAVTAFRYRRRERSQRWLLRSYRCLSPGHFA